MLPTLNIHVLGTAQDSGLPQIGCNCDNCKMARLFPGQASFPCALAISQPNSKHVYLLDATPAFPQQLDLLQQHTHGSYLPAATLLTHAHIGHYTGLMYLGKEALNAQNHPVYCTPAMAHFLSSHAPWRDLVHNNNIALRPLVSNEVISLADSLTVQAIDVPHRNEYADTVGFIIGNDHKKIFYLPDIDSWAGFEETLNQILKQVDLAFIDGTFWTSDELNLKRKRDFRYVPHPPIKQTMELFQKGVLQRGGAQINFIHFNHTNPIYNADQSLKALLRHNNFGYAQEGQIYRL